MRKTELSKQKELDRSLENSQTSWKIILSKKSNKAIDLENGSSEAGTHISQYFLPNRWNQQWFIKSTGSDAKTYKNTSRHSGLFLDIAGASNKGAWRWWCEPTMGIEKRPLTAIFLLNQLIRI